MAAHCHLYALHFVTTHETFTGPSESTLAKCSNYTPKCRCEQGELHTKLFVLPAAAALFPHWSQIFLSQGPHRTQPSLPKGHLGHFPLLPQRILNSILQTLNLPSFAFAFLLLKCRGKEHILGTGSDTWLRISPLLERLSYLLDPIEWCGSTIIISPDEGWRAAERKGCISITLGHLLPSVISFFPSAPQHQLSSHHLDCILFTLHTLSAFCDTVRPVSLTSRKQIWAFKTSLHLPFLPDHAQPCLPSFVPLYWI